MTNLMVKMAQFKVQNVNDFSGMDTYERWSHERCVTSSGNLD